MTKETWLRIATVEDLDLYLASSQSAEPHRTHARANIRVYPMTEQANICGEWPTVKIDLIPDEVTFYMPIMVGHILLAKAVIQRVDQILGIDQTKPHKAVGQHELYELLSNVETIFYGSQVIGPDILLPFH